MSMACKITMGFSFLSCNEIRITFKPKRKIIKHKLK